MRKPRSRTKPRQKGSRRKGMVDVWTAKLTAGPYPPTVPDTV
jgi:hypothetical protein